MSGRCSPAIQLLDKQCPALVEDLPAWFNTLDARQLDSVWVSAIVTFILEDAPNADIASMTRALNLVRNRYRFLSVEPLARVSGEEHSTPQQAAKASA
jgi:hypothetical protein